MTGLDEEVTGLDKEVTGLDEEVTGLTNEARPVESSKQLERIFIDRTHPVRGDLTRPVSGLHFAGI